MPKEVAMTDHVNHPVRLNVHTWSDHPEVNHLVEEVWNALGQDQQSTLSSKSNRKGTPPKKILKVLLVHLYATWLDDPTLWTGMSRNRNDYAPDSIYNALHIPFKIKDITDYLVDLEYLDFEMGSNDKTYDGWYSYTSRIRPNRRQAKWVILVVPSILNSQLRYFDLMARNFDTVTYHY